METIVPNKRLNAERLEKLELLGFAWSAKNVARKKSPSPVVPGKAKKPPIQEDVGRSSTRQRVNDAQWDEMYHRLALYKEFHGVSTQIGTGMKLPVSKLTILPHFLDARIAWCLENMTKILNWPLGLKLR